MKWNASWIWDESDDHPLNYRACFRRRFNCSVDAAGRRAAALLHIVGDSAYVLYLNGHYLGQGPARSWPFEQSYDTYDVGHILVPGRDNVVAVMVTHHGQSDCQYVEGRGGLLVEIEGLSNDGSVLVATDRTWRTVRHHGFRTDTVKISNGLPWTEVYDARSFAPDWTEVEFDDSAWSPAREIGAPGMEPWTSLVPRGIPLLSQELVYPDRVVEINETTSFSQHATIDLRTVFFPDEVSINQKLFLGYVATIIDVPTDTEGKILLYVDKWAKLRGRVRVNEESLDFENFMCFPVRLRKGSNLLLVDASHTAMHPALHLGFDFPVKLTFRAPSCEHTDPDVLPLSATGISKPGFTAIGPYGRRVIVQTGIPQDDSLPVSDEFDGVFGATNEEELTNIEARMQVVPKEAVCADDVFTLILGRTVVKRNDVPEAAHSMVRPNPSATGSATRLETGEHDLEYVVDFGAETSGYFEMDLEAEAGSVLDLFFFESRHDGIIEYTYGTSNTLRYITRDGYQRHRSPVRRGFRYVMIVLRAGSGPVSIASVRAWQSTYPVAKTGRFACSDSVLNRAWEISQRTTQLCMEDTFVDCPAYEQTFWVGDARNEALISTYLFGAPGIVRRSLSLVPKSMFRSPIPECTIPSGWQSMLTAWALLWMISCREYYFHHGDAGFRASIYPDLIRAARGFERFINADNLLEISAWNMLDWAPMDTPREGIVTHQNALLVRAFEQTAVTADELGHTEDAAWLRNTVSRVRSAINKHLWDEHGQAYIDSMHADGKRSDVQSIQTQSMVYLCDCASPERSSIIEGYIRDPGERFFPIGSPFVLFFYFEALEKIGELPAVIENIRRNWGMMLDHDATTCWETFQDWDWVEGYYTRSYCHAWSAAPAYFLPASVLGVKPLEPGFRKVQVKPNLCGLEWARGTVPVPGGVIEVSVRMVDGERQVEVTVPEGVEVVRA
jgi:alpha-L-rhamnosidase